MEGLSEQGGILHRTKFSYPVDYGCVLYHRILEHVISENALDNKSTSSLWDTKIH
jgi:hypothetical protein